MTTRNPNPELTPDAFAIISEVNFTTTRAGLTGQVRTHERPMCVFINEWAVLKLIFKIDTLSPAGINERFSFS